MVPLLSSDIRFIRRVEFNGATLFISPPLIQKEKMARVSGGLFPRIIRNGRDNASRRTTLFTMPILFERCGPKKAKIKKNIDITEKIFPILSGLSLNT